METRSPKYTNMRDKTHDHIKVIKVFKITTKGVGSQTQTKDASEAGTKNNTETKVKDAETMEVTKTKRNTSEKADTNAKNNDIAKATGPNTSRTEESRDPNTIATDTAQR